MPWDTRGTETLGGTASVITIDPVIPVKFNVLLTHLIESGVVDTPPLTFNNDSGNNYARRQSSDGGNDSLTPNTTGISASSGTASPNFLVNYYVNIFDEEKLVLTWLCAGASASAGVAPVRAELASKWSNTANLVTRVDYTEPSAGDFATDSNISVIGTD